MYARFATVIVVLALAAPTRAQPVFTVVNLADVVDSSLALGRAINNSGQVAGVGITSDSQYGLAFRTAPGGVGPSLNVAPGTGADAYAINSLGQTTGDFLADPNHPAAGNYAYRASATTGIIGAAGTNLGSLVGSVASVGQGINDTGQVAGNVEMIVPGTTSNYYYKAFRTTATGGVDSTALLGMLPGAFSVTNYPSSKAYAINSSGQVTGTATTATPYIWHAFRTAATGSISDPGTDLGLLPGASGSAPLSVGKAINDSGQVAGYSSATGGSEHAFRTTATGTLSDPGADLGTLPGGFSSEAYGIDALGEVVGIASTANDTAHAMLYTNQMWDLNSLIPANSGWVLERAYGVNDDLWITGDGYLNGVRTGFLLIPAVSTEDARQELMVVPEPSSLLLGGGALLFGWLVRRRAMLTAA